MDQGTQIHSFCNLLSSFLLNWKARCKPNGQSQPKFGPKWVVSLSQYNSLLHRQCIKKSPFILFMLQCFVGVFSFLLSVCKLYQNSKKWWNSFVSLPGAPPGPGGCPGFVKEDALHFQQWLRQMHCMCACFRYWYSHKEVLLTKKISASTIRSHSLVNQPDGIMACALETPLMGYS